MYKLKYFTEAEMRITKDTPLDIIQNCYNLAEFVLDPLRELIKKPILVNSWYRNPVYNAQVGGAKNSQHTFGEAADIVVKGMTVEEVYATIITNNIPFDQIIVEYDNVNKTTWIHISFRSLTKNRKSKLKAVKEVGKKWVYTPINGGLKHA